MTKIIRNKNDNSTIKLILIISVLLLLFFLLFVVTACIVTNFLDEKNRAYKEEMATDPDIEVQNSIARRISESISGTRSTSPVEITEGTSVSVAETHATTTTTTETKPEEASSTRTDRPEADILSMIPEEGIKPTYQPLRAECAGDNETVYEYKVCSIPFYSHRWSNSSIITDEVYEFLSEHQQVIPIYLYNEQPFNGTVNLGPSVDDTDGVLYYIQLDGLIFPTTENDPNYFFYIGRTQLISNFYRWQIYVDSDFIPDSEGIIHGSLYISSKFDTWDMSCDHGQEVFKEDLISLNELFLAIGLASPDRSYTGFNAEVYAQYPDVASDYEGYPMGVDTEGNFLPGFYYDSQYDYDRTYTPYMEAYRYYGLPTDYDNLDGR